MSKKEKLRVQKEKQDKLMQEMELQEQREIEAARSGMSKSAERFIKKAKKERKNGYEGKVLMLLKLLMLIPLAYSGIFYCAVTVAGIATGYMSEMPKWVGAVMGIGSLIIIAGVLFAFFKKYIISFIAVLAGTVFYMRGAMYIIDNISDKLKNYSGANPDLMDMDKDYMLYYYPIMIVTLFSFIMAIISIVKKIKKKKRLQSERDNAPVKSIIEE
ncbi:MAG: hypothetical protein K2F81_00150 [Ruminococcus sp.]|nr:hypothetical protein [Ruminococcus sp.]